MLFSGLIYKCKWDGHNATYYGKTKVHFKVQIFKHIGISHLAGPKVKIANLLCCSYSPSLEDFPILTKDSNNFSFKIMETLLIACDKCIFNKADSSLPLTL